MEVVKGYGHIAGVKLTRPNDTNAYTAGDVVNDSASAGTVLTIPAQIDGANGFTLLQELICISSQNAATKPDLELWLFSEAPAAQNDNAPFAVTDAELAKLVGIVTIPVASFKVANTGAAAVGNVVCDVLNLSMPICTPAGSKGVLYGVVIVRNAYAPVALEEFTFILKFLD